MTNMSMSLPLPKAGQINHICHISDIHIRAGIESRNDTCSRFSEYLNVFNNIASFLHHHYTENDTVICITGDILHDNRKAGAPCIELFYSILHKLAEICPVYIIRGNHDYNQSSIEVQDMITALLTGINHPNIAYLSQTGLYHANNITFGIVAIQDVLKKGDTCGLIDAIPPFPKAPLHSGNEHFNIALFHGDVHRQETSIDWIIKDNNYDFALLGDIHTMQVCHSGTFNIDDNDSNDSNNDPFVYPLNTFTHNKSDTTMWAYAGSTLQQNYGESLVGHGFLMWDLHAKKIHAYHVKNDYGFVTAQLDQDTKQVLINASFVRNQNTTPCFIPLQTFCELRWRPSIIRLRVQKDKLYGYQEISYIQNTLSENGFIIESSQMAAFSQDIIQRDKTYNSIDLNSFNQPATWYEFLKEKLDTENMSFKCWKNWIFEPSSLLLCGHPVPDCLSQSIKKDIIEKNKKIDQSIIHYRDVFDKIIGSKVTHTHFELLYMNWSHILCFDTDCHFNFQNLKGNVYCIGGKNGFGKTSFLETIIIALFGEGFPSRICKHMSSSIISMGKSRGYTSLVIQLDTDRYRIKRTFVKVSKDEGKLQSRDAIIEKWDDNSFHEIKSGKKATTEWIVTHIGSLDTFLTSCMISQSGENNFFDKKSVDQKMYLDTQLKLNASSSLLTVFKTAKLAYTDIAKRIQDLIEVERDGIQDTHNVPTLREYQNQLESEMENTHKNIEQSTIIVDHLERTTPTLDETILRKGLPQINNELHEKLWQLDTMYDYTRYDLDSLSQKKAIINSQFIELQRFYVKTLSTNTIKKNLDELNKRSLDLPSYFDEFSSLSRASNKIKEILGDAITKSQNDIEQRLENIQKHIVSYTKKKDFALHERDNLKQKEIQIQSTITQILSKPPPHPEYSEQQYLDYMNTITFLEDLYNTRESLDQCIHDEIEGKKHEGINLDLDENAIAQKMHNNTNALHHWNSYTQKLMNNCGLSEFDFKHCWNTDKTMNINAVMALKKELQQSIHESEINYIHVVENVSAFKKESIKHQTFVEKILESYSILLKNKPPTPYFATDHDREKASIEFNKRCHAFLNDDQKDLEKIIEKKSFIHNNHSHHLVQFQNIKQQGGQIIDLLKDGEDYPFNPQCEACKKHPWKTKRDALEKQINHLRDEQHVLETFILREYGPEYLNDQTHVNNLIIENKKYLDDYAYFITQREFWEREKCKQIEFETWQAKVKDYEIKKKYHEQQFTHFRGSCEKECENENHLSQNIKRMKDALVLIDNALVEWIDTYKDKVQTHENDKLILQKWQPWKAHMNKLFSHRDKWMQLNAVSHGHTLAREHRKQSQQWDTSLKNENHALSNIRFTIHALDEKLKEYKHHIERYNDIEGQLKQELALLIEFFDIEQKIKRIIEYKEWDLNKKILEKRLKAHKLYDQLETLEAELKHKRKHNVICDEIDYIEKCIACYDDWKKLRFHRKNIRVLHEKQANTRTELSRNHDKLKKYEHVISEIDALTLFQEDMNNQLHALGKILDVFGSFKDWIMEEKIIPILLHHLNALLSEFCIGHRQLTMNCEIDPTSQNFMWFVKDGVHNIPFEKTSGFQKCAMGLAMRIVLGNLGVVGIRNSQLFIDEGFTACDTDNLRHVPTVLESLLQNYQTILMVTHIDELKSYFPDSVNITRDNNKHTSKLTFGDKHDTFDTIKKMGRPRRRNDF